jgi:hypothetical protein
MRVISAIHEPDVASAILGCLGMPTDVPGTARARDPADDDELDPSGGDGSPSAGAPHFNGSAAAIAASPTHRASPA